jgi:heme exporter protein A
MVSESCKTVEAFGLSVIRGRVHILRDVDLAVAKGEVVAIMGPNGAGKSTLLACLAGTLRPTSGELHRFGNAATRSADAKCQVGFVGHQTGLYSELTALENLRFAARMHGVERSHERAQSLLAEAGLESTAHRPVAQLSQGMRRRLAISRALVPEPLLILLDEPFASLDADGSEWLEQLFHNSLRLARTVVFTSHDVAHSRRLAGRIIWLDAGRIAATEYPLNVVARSSKSA